MYYAFVRDGNVINLIETGSDIVISPETDGNFVVCNDEQIINDTVTFYHYNEKGVPLLYDKITALRPGWTFVDGEFVPPPTKS